MTDKTSQILIVDDEADEQRNIFQLAFDHPETTLRIRHPQDVRESDLIWAHVVLMDQRIEHWPERDDGHPLSLRPLSGVALASIYRDHIEKLDAPQALTAIAVHSGHLDDLCGRLPKDRSAHVIARLNDLEWAFQKDEDAIESRVHQLAEAVRELPLKWPKAPNDAETEAKRLLALPNSVNWAERVWEDVQRSQIPLLDLVGGAHGLLFVRWLLHSILPYPTFLWSEPWLAARLGIRPESLTQVLNSKSKLTNDLEILRYRGVLADFQGSRWWKGAVEQWAWEVQQKAQGEERQFHDALEDLAGANLERIQVSSPSVCIGPDLHSDGTIADITEVVRLVPDLWPAFADSALSLRSRVIEDPDLRAIVHPLDRASILDEE